MFLRKALQMFTRPNNRWTTVENTIARESQDRKPIRTNISSRTSTLTEGFNQNNVGGGFQYAKLMQRSYGHGGRRTFHIPQIVPQWKRAISRGSLLCSHSADGPMVLKNRNVSPYNSDMKLVLPTELPCRIHVLNPGMRVHHGLGCYFGNGHVLTAYHVIKSAYSAEIIVLFQAEDGFLVYSAEFNRFCRIYPHRDLGSIKLLGDTSPLGEGFHRRLGDVHKGDPVYFYTLDERNRYQRREGKVINPHRLTVLNQEVCTVSVTGREGDSGTPVYRHGSLVGVYCGVVRHTQEGYFSKLIRT